MVLAAGHSFLPDPTGVSAQHPTGVSARDPSNQAELAGRFLGWRVHRLC